MTEFLELVGRGLITQNLILLQGLGMYALTRHTKTISGALKAGVSMLAAMLTAGLGVWFLSALAIPESLSFFAYLVVASLAAFLWQRLLEMPDSFSGGLMDSALLVHAAAHGQELHYGLCCDRLCGQRGVGLSNSSPGDCFSPVSAAVGAHPKTIQRCSLSFDYCWLVGYGFCWALSCKAVQAARSAPLWGRLFWAQKTENTEIKQGYRPYKSKISLAPRGYKED